MTDVAFRTPAGVPVPAVTAAELRAVDRVAVDPDLTLTLALPRAGRGGRAETILLADIAIPRTVYDRLDIPADDPFGAQMWVELCEETEGDDPAGARLGEGGG